MMIGRQEWFKPRKYGGWGITPKTWQGWVYIGVMMASLVIISYLDEQIRMAATIGWLSIFLMDVFSILITMKKDKMENKFEALAERNAAWAMVAAIAVLTVYQAYSIGTINYFMIGVLLFGAAAKCLTYIVLQVKGG
jgi:hypothetical protein